MTDSFLAISSFMIEHIIRQDFVDTFAQWVATANNIVIIGHINSDGDSIGSTLGMKHYLDSLDKKAQVIVPNYFPDNLKWMPGAKQIPLFDRQATACKKMLEQADLIICQDLNEPNRMGDIADVVASLSTHKILIDHHLNPAPFADITISHPKASSASELVFRLIYQSGGLPKLPKLAAECLYCGMMTDTGSFTYNSNNPQLFRIIAELIEKGIDKDQIYRNVYNTCSEGRLRLQGYQLYEKMRIYPEYGAALITMTSEELKRFKCNKGDTEGNVNLPLTMKGIHLSAFLREDTEQNCIRISLRSVGNIPCNKIAKEFFNGGGHFNASGGNVACTLEQATRLFEEALHKFQDVLQRVKTGS